MRKKAVVLFLIIFVWILATFGFIFSILILAPGSNNTNHLSLHLAEASRNLFDFDEKDSNENAGVVLAGVRGGDSRAALIDRFLSKYNSPMVGTGEAFVKTADKYDLDWRLLPGIAFQESSLGKKIPRNSYNPFGWGIFAGKNSGAYFRSWEHGIEVVGAGMRTDYFNRGVNSLDEIALRYTAGTALGSWVFAVSSAMEEISPKAF
jgi:hypothetical protein